MTAPPIPVSATHYIPLDEVKRWLAEHGANIDDVIDVTIRITSTDRIDGHAHAVSAWADLRWHKAAAGGTHRYFEGDDTAQGSSTIPLRSFPHLTPAP